MFIPMRYFGRFSLLALATVALFATTLPGYARGTAAGDTQNPATPVPYVANAPGSQAPQNAPPGVEPTGGAGANAPGGQIPGSREQQAAYRFLERRLTYSGDYGDPRWLHFEHGTVCRLRCGDDSHELEFVLSDIALQTIAGTSSEEALVRGTIGFGTSDGEARFWERYRDYRKHWSSWKNVDAGKCIIDNDEAKIKRTIRALAYLAASCGAKETRY